MEKANWPKTLRNACLAGIYLATLLITGCASDGSSPLQTVTIPNSNSGGGNEVQTGRVIVLLADPSTGEVDPALQKTLSYQGVDDDLNLTFGPITKGFSPAIAFDGVPVGTTGIEIFDPNDGSLFAEVEVLVKPGGTTYASDVVFRPGRAALGTIRAKAGDPVQLGAGFIQTRLSNLGPAGSSPTMAGFDAASVTSAMKTQFPYRTNTWLSPVLWSDNVTPYWIGGRKETSWQQPVYPKPWNFRFDYQSVGPDPETTAKRRGLNLGLERVRSSPGAQLPSPQGEASNQNVQLTQIQSTFDVRALKIDPGFLPKFMKVARIGDYDAEFVLRAVDDPNFAPVNPDDIKKTLHMTVVRGNPILYFKAISLSEINLSGNELTDINSLLIKIGNHVSILGHILGKCAGTTLPNKVLAHVLQSSIFIRL